MKIPFDGPLGTCRKKADPKDTEKRLYFRDVIRWQGSENDHHGHAKESLEATGMGRSAFTFLLAAAWFVYEQIGRGQDSRHQFRIGRSVYIGDRSLNIDCSGSGSPTVILESGAVVMGAMAGG
ncbi:MAG TPA: hypothetical protein VEI01_25275 [Terriglobales bacterium]|nr:hypothetical protein [Terriglobales bacterium]